MATALFSLDGVAQWIDNSVTETLERTIAPMVAHATAEVWPFVTAAMTISLMWYGWLIASGAIQTPVLTALKRVVNIVIIVSIVGTGGLYQTEIVGALLKLPSELTSALSEKASDPAKFFDDTSSEGVTIGTKITNRAPNSLTSPVQAMTFVIVAHVVALISAAVSAIGLILLVVVKSGMGMLAILGPLCLLALLSEYTKGYFDKWVSQVLYYGLHAAIFTAIFGIIIGMFGTLQKALLATAESKGEINLFSMLAAVIIFMITALFMISQAKAIASAIAGSGGSGLNIPFLGNVG